MHTVSSGIVIYQDYFSSYISNDYVDKLYMSPYYANDYTNKCQI